MADRRDLYIDQGSTVGILINVTDDEGEPLDLTTYEKRAQMRRHFSSNSYFEFTTDTGNSEIGEIILSMTAEYSANIPAGRYNYDVEIVNSSDEVFRVLEGVISVMPEVTR